MSLSLLPNEMIDRISDELTGMDLFHFILVYGCSVNCNKTFLIRLLSRQSIIPLIEEAKFLLVMPHSPYVMVDDCVSIPLWSCKWKQFVYGPFKLNVIERSLKYFLTSLFTLYCRLWSFSPFYYQSTYPTLEIFKYSYLLQSRTLTMDERLLFKVMGNNQVPPKIVTNYTDFVSNFIRRFDYDVWGSDVDWDLFIVAGGAIVSSLLVECPHNSASDIDLFFIKENAHIFQRAVDALESRLLKKYFVQRKTIWLNHLIQFDLFQRFTIGDVFNGRSFTPSIVIQLIRPTTTFTNISKILHSFDLDICSAAFNSKQVIITFGCLQALNSGCSTCYAISNSPSKFVTRTIRFYKYQQRGYNILCPRDFDIKVFMNTSIEDCKESQLARTYRFRKRQFGENCDSFELQKKFCEYYNLT